MKRPAGVIVTAIVALLGSLGVLGLLAAEIFALGMLRSRSAVPPEAMFGLVLGMVVFTVLPIWGITTAIGLLKLRNWARISTIVFSSLMAVMSLFSAPMIFIVPAPPNAPPGFSKILIGIAAFYLTLGLLGVVWIIYFTRAKTKAAFAGAVEWESARPLSISIIAWVMVVSGLISLPMSFLHLPVALLGFIFSGWSATAGMMVLALAYILIGYGLLQLKPGARIAGIAVFLLFAINGIVFALMPASEAKILEAMRGTLLAPPANQPVPQMPAAWMLILVPMMAVPLWFLITRKSAFERPQVDVAGSDLTP